jgi:cyclopropane fatty-acyl-phospholipid synthase-like methyltransferase
VSHDRYVPALRFRWLTGFYDPLMERWTAASRVRQAVIEALGLRPGLRLLELGCGPGRLAIEIKRRWPTVAIDALDGDPEILQVARRNAAEAGVEIAFREADIARLAATGPYDRVYSTLVFHHLSPVGKHEASAAVQRALARDGSFVIADFGRPRGALQWVLYSVAGWVDGAENTIPHRDGRFEQALRASFGSVRSTAMWRTIFGTIEVFVCQP